MREAVSSTPPEAGESGPVAAYDELMRAEHLCHPDGRRDLVQDRDGSLDARALRALQARLEVREARLRLPTRGGRGVERRNRPVGCRHAARLVPPNVRAKTLTP